MGYLTSFIVYMFAMVGVIMFAFIIFKKSCVCTRESISKKLKVVDSISLGARKNLYIVAAGNENFLIAGDVDRTTFISKLSMQNNLPEQFAQNIEEYNDNKLEKIGNYSCVNNNFSSINMTSRIERNAVMKKLAEKMKG